jgi:hypothetical protein
MGIFGEVKTARDVERRVIATLQYWMEVYLRNRELEMGVKEFFAARPQAYMIANAWDDKNPEHATPFIAVISDGMADPPRQEGNGGFICEWGITVGVIAEGPTALASEELVKDYYLPVIELIMLQKQSLRDWNIPDAPPWSMGVEWYGESYPDLLANIERSVFAGQADFSVMVRSVIDRFAGPSLPADPETQPGSSWPEFTTAHLEVEKVDEVGEEE